MVLIKKFKYSNVQLPANTEIELKTPFKLFNWNAENLQITEKVEDLFSLSLLYMKENNFFVKVNEYFSPSVIQSGGDYYFTEGNVTLNIEGNNITIYNPNYKLVFQKNSYYFYIGSSTNSYSLNFVFYYDDGTTQEISYYSSNYGFWVHSISDYSYGFRISNYIKKPITKIEISANTTIGITTFNSSYIAVIPSDVTLEPIETTQIIEPYQTYAKNYLVLSYPDGISSERSIFYKIQLPNRDVNIGLPDVDTIELTEIETEEFNLIKNLNKL